MRNIERIALATANSGKIREFNAIFADLPFNLVSQEELEISSVAENGLTFVENALIKARHVARNCDMPVIADDSGLIIDALHGEPGVLSARYAGAEANMSDNVAKVLAKLQNVPKSKRNAYFYCVIVYLRYAEDPVPLICQGKWQGEILTEASGCNGFGYDPIFFVPDYSCSAADLPGAVKNRISHRALALRQLISVL